MATTTTRESLFTYGLPNMMLNICIVLEIVFAVLVIYWKPAENTYPLALPVGFACRFKQTLRCCLLSFSTLARRFH